MITRDQIATILEEIALLLELKGENPFKIRAYRTGAEVVQTHSEDLLALAGEEDLKPLEAVKGIGSALAKKFHELVTTGKLAFYDDLKAEFPETIFELFEIQGLGPKKVKALYEELGIDSAASLKTACEKGEVAGLSGFGQKTEKKILEAIAFQEANADQFRMGHVAPQVEEIRDALKAHPQTTRVEVAGSYRRGKETVHDLDFLVATPKPKEIMDFFVSQPFVESVINHGSTKSSIRLEDGLQCDLRAVSPEEYPCALVYFTGSKEHNIALRSLALKQGYSLNEYSLSPAEPKSPKTKTTSQASNVTPKKKPPAIHEEADVYKALGLDYIEPELRENAGEIEAAANHSLPRLVETGNLHGTFHNHTTASDGQNSLREMADAAMELGLEYLGIADHSKSSFQANGLDEKRLLKQVAEIRKLNDEFGKKFRIFAGTECDILKDGTLDFDEATLAQLDYSVASVHSSFTLGEAAMTKRIIKAIESPYITMLGHLTGRLLLKREPYAVDIPAVIDAAAATGTIIELNASPWRLDMDWRWWRLAAEKGVRCSINPDAHRTAALQFLYLGVKSARKGWLTKNDVINCLPLSKIETELQRKRASASK